MSNITFKVELNERQRGELQLLVDGMQGGKMDISISSNLLTVYHTEVDAVHEGKGYAKLLLNALVGYAEEHKMKIVPLCPYVHLQFKRNPEKYADIWHKREG